MSYCYGLTYIVFYDIILKFHIIQWQIFPLFLKYSFFGGEIIGTLELNLSSSITLKFEADWGSALKTTDLGTFRTPTALKAADWMRLPLLFFLLQHLRIYSDTNKKTGKKLLVTVNTTSHGFNYHSNTHHQIFIPCRSPPHCQRSLNGHRQSLVKKTRWSPFHSKQNDVKLYSSNRVGFFSDFHIF